jgi:uncharacterized protein DUF4153
MTPTVARRLVVLALILGIVAEVLLYRVALGINVPILAVLALGAAWLARRPQAALDPLDRWLAPAALLFALGPALRADDVMVASDTAAAILLTVAAAAAFTGAAITRQTAIGAAAVATRALFLFLCGAAWLASLTRPAVPTGMIASERTASVLRGVLLAVPIVLAFAVLFAMADAVFDRIVFDVVTLRVDLGDLPVRLGVAALFAWLAGGLLLVAREPTGLLRPIQSLGAAARAPAVVLPRLGSIEAVIVLGCVDLLFAAFIVLQVAYLFGGRDTLAASGLTYADYARRGFVELVIVAALAAALVWTLDQAVATRTRRFLALAVVLVGLSGVVLMSAGLRLRLYQEAYGWTELRFYVYAAIGWLAVGLAAVAVLLLRNRMARLSHALVIGGLAVGVFFNVLGPVAFVAGRNVDRALDPALVPAGGRPGLDVPYIAQLSDDAVPALVGALPRLPALQRLEVTATLRGRWDALRSDPELTAPQAWNLGRERARAALRELFGR